MTEIGYATLAVIPSFKNFGRELERGTSSDLTSVGRNGGDKFGAAAGKSAGHKFSGTFGKIAKAGAFAALGGLALGGKILGDSIGAASDLGETMSKTAQIFGKDAIPALEKFADTAAQGFGQSKQQALDAAATFGIFGKAAGLQGRKLVKFTTGLDALASDMASFSNTSPEEAINAIGSALRGEAEPIRAYGVLLDDATLKAEALRLGLLKPTKDKSKILASQARVTVGQAKYNEELKKYGKDSIEAIKAQASLGTAQSTLQKAVKGTIPPLTQQQKVLAAQSSIYKQTKDQQGDFARTSGGLANQQRILAARFDNAKASLGKGLLPVATQVVTYLNTKGVPALDKFSDWFTKKGVPAINNFSDKATPFVKGVLSDTRDILADIAPYAKKVADAFNSLPAGAKKGLGAAALLGAAGSKIPGGKAGGGAIASVAKLVLPKKPLPVFVVNNGAGGGLGKGVAGAGAGAGGVLGAGVAALTIYAVGVKLVADKVAKGAGVDPLQLGRDAAGQQQLLTPTFKPDAQVEALKKAAFYSNLTRQNLSKLPSDFNKGLNGAESLKQQVFGIEQSAKRSKSNVVSLIDALEAARQAAVKVEQAVTVARQSKVDRQLGGGMYVANMNVHGTSLTEVQRDAQHKRRARAIGAESFAP